MTQESSQGNEDPQETIKPECFYTSFDEECKVTEKCDRTKGQELRVPNWGQLSKEDCLFRFLSVSSFSPERGRSRLTGGSFDLLPGRREGQRLLPTPAISQIPSAWNIQCSKVPYLGGSMFLTLSLSQIKCI